MACKSMRWTRACAGALTWMRVTAVHLVRQGLLRMPLAGVQRHRHVYAQGVCTGKLWRQLPILQCMLHAHKAVGLGCGQRCQIRYLEGHMSLISCLETVQPLTSEKMCQHSCRTLCSNTQHYAYGRGLGVCCGRDWSGFVGSIQSLISDTHKKAAQESADALLPGRAHPAGQI